MLNNYDKQILELEEKIYNLENYASNLQTTNESLRLNLNRTDAAMKKLAKTTITLSYTGDILKLVKGTMFCM